MIRISLDMAAQGGFWLSKPATETAARSDAVFYFIFWLSFFFFLLIVGLMVIFIIKYRRRPGVEASGPSHNTALEVTWTVIPLILVVVIFGLGFTVFLDMHTPPANAYEIQVQGQKWNWYFEYPNGFIEADVLHVPGDKPVRLVLSSADVIHSFFVPAFRLKRDAVPGRFTKIWFPEAEPGEYPFFCTEYCGTGHSTMSGTLIVHPPGEFENWLKDASKSWLEGLTEPQLAFWLEAQDTAQLVAKFPQLAELLPKMQTPTERGRTLYLKNGCTQCHSTDGGARVGPSFTGIWERTRTGATVFRDNRALGEFLSPEYSPEDYIHESIMNPNAKIVKGYRAQMQSYQGRISDRDVRALIQYFKTLTAAAGE